MILAVLAFLAALASAQTSDARALMQEIAASSRATKSWRAEGVEVGEVTGNGIHVRNEARFKIAVQGPSKMRWETSGDNDTLVVCDGADHWTHYSHGGFHSSSVSVSPCTPERGDFSQMTENLTTATAIGRDQIQVAGGPQECELVRVEYAAAGSPGGSAIRTLCIDTTRKLVLRDSSETVAAGVHAIMTTTYSVYEREPALSPDTFKFAAPTGTLEDEGPQMGGGQPIAEGGVYRIGLRVSAPALVNKVEPSYTEEARQSRISGMALVSLAVDAKGRARNIMVVSGLGHGLDQKAIEAVRRWSFRPGRKDGAPVAVRIKVAVNFRLP
jgi:TonB family protein